MKKLKEFWKITTKAARDAVAVYFRPDLQVRRLIGKPPSEHGDNKIFFFLIAAIVLIILILPVFVSLD